MKTNINKILFSLFILSSTLYSYNSELIKSESPYIKKYANKKINWREYNSKLFEEAKKNKKLIFLSIGNNNCEWCDKQDALVFEDEEASKLMNIYYIPIKIDSEQTPNIAKKYGDILKTVTNSTVTLPLSVILDTEGRIIYMKNYIPLDGKDGILKLLPTISRKMDYSSFRKKVRENNNKINEIISSKISKEGKNIKTTRLVSAFVSSIKNKFDSELGGIRIPSGKKYIFQPIMNASIEISNYNKDKKIRWVAEFTAQSIIDKGIMDQVEGGFFSYTYDRYWTEPSFKKTLDTNARAIKLLSKVYFEINRDIDIRNVIVFTYNFLKKRLKDEKSGLYYTKIMDKRKEKPLTKEEEDEGRKKDIEFSGKYYLFHKDIIQEKPNYDEEYVYIDRRLTQTEKERYMKIRKKKEYPEIDKRVFFSENALLSQAFIGVGVINEDIYKEGYSILEKLIEIYKKEKNISHLVFSKKDNEEMLIDYSVFVQTLILAYNDTFEDRYLKLAIEVTKKLEKKFFIENKWYLSNSKFKTEATLVSELYKNSALAILFSNYNRLLHTTLDFDYNVKKQKIIDGYYVEIMYDPLKNALSIEELNNDNYKKYTVVGNKNNILKVKNIYGNKYYYFVKDIKEIKLIKNNKQVKVVAEDIDTFKIKEKKVMDKIKDDKFILFID